MFPLVSKNSKQLAALYMTEEALAKKEKTMQRKHSSHLWNINTCICFMICYWICIGYWYSWVLH